MKRKTVVVNTEAVLYYRVSTRQQAETGLGLLAQQKACHAHAARMGLKVVGEYEDRGVSGKKGLEKRPGLRDAIAATRAAPGRVLIVYSLSRLARSMKMLVEVLALESGSPLPIISTSEPFDVTTSIGRAMVNMIATFAMLESDLCSERTIEALACVEDRSRLGAPGMTERVVDGVRSACPVRLAKCARVRALRDEGLTYRAIAAHLNAMGERSVEGCSWHAATVMKAVHAG